ncbi:RDD family protein [uncultured Methanomethylovorans sp.]|uniref:RDD family protein n=1 Tax=uncultured Methanomethylovorans sp. TaxID=183759 RepID=UPI002AA949B0|nr:RDD family protein [uncultured Methanomethylovorans sp.]
MEEIKYAGFWRRFFASLIDDTVIGIVFFLFAMLFALLSPFLIENENVGIVILLMLAVLAMLYYPYFESSAEQATLGKQLMGIIVIDRSGQRISFGKACIRFILKYIGIRFFALGILPILFSENKQALHDLVVDSYVVHR